MLHKFTNWLSVNFLSFSCYKIMEYVWTASIYMYIHTCLQTCPIDKMAIKYWLLSVYLGLQHFVTMSC